MTPHTQPQHQFGDEFAILRTLGRGTFATVYLAREESLKRLVAIKVLGERFASDPTARQRFMREGRSAARLAHPNIVGIHRVAELETGSPYIVMEYVDGQNLTDAMASGVLNVETGSQILSQVARGLASAHEQGIVHRDVCPDNILWDADAHRAVLTDFGIAAILDQGGEAVTQLTRAGEVLGNPQYSSPEQLQGQPLTGGADVYALSIIGYELFAGRGPFEATSIMEITVAHIKGEPKPLSTLAPQLNKSVADLLTRGLAKKPEQRPRAADLAMLLDKLTAVGTDKPGVSLFGNPTLDDAAEQLPAFMGFYRELRQRHVFNVAAVYAALTYVVLQVADLILPELPLPDWTYTALVAVTLAGFPITLVLAWSYDLTEQGVQRSDRIAPAKKGLNALRVLGFLASLVVAALIGWWILSG